MASRRHPLRWLQPDYIEGRVEDIDLDGWWQKGIRGLILDVDDTLTLHNSPLVADPVVSWLKTARQKGFKCFIVSNNKSPAHIEKLAQMLEMPALAQARKPRSNGFLWALKQMELPPDQVVAIGDRVLTDILGGASCGLRTCLVAPVTQNLSRRKRTLYAFEKWLSRSFRI